MSTKPVDYVTVIDPVFEITLLGTAHYDIWKSYLEAEDLEISPVQDNIDIHMTLVDSKFRGIRFQELSLSIKTGEDRYFLVHAYNSIALFALVERTFFQTPYYKGDIVLETTHVKLSRGGSTLFEASLPQVSDAVSKGYECENSQVYLPKYLRKKPSQPHFFYVKLEGDTKAYAAEDASISITPGSDDAILQLLKKSHFQVHHWRTRATGRHSRTKTYTQGSIGVSRC